MEVVVIVILVLLFVVIISIFAPNSAKEYHYIDDMEKRIAGEEGESIARNILNKYTNESDVIVNNVNISVHGRNTELDFVVINKNGVFIFEVKNFSGELEGEEDDDYWMKYKISSGNQEYSKELRNPIKQLKREIYLLKEYLNYYNINLWIEGYVLFVNMNSPIESDYTINDEAEIDNILHHKREQNLSKRKIEEIVKLMK